VSFYAAFDAGFFVPFRQITLHMINYTSQYQTQFEDFSPERLRDQLELDPNNRWIQCDKIYHTNDNRKWCSTRNIRMTALPKGPKPKLSAYEKKKKRDEYAERNHIEGCIDNIKQALSLNQIKAKQGHIRDLDRCHLVCAKPLCLRCPLRRDFLRKP